MPRSTWHSRQCLGSPTFADTRLLQQLHGTLGALPSVRLDKLSLQGGSPEKLASPVDCVDPTAGEAIVHSRLNAYSIARKEERVDVSRLRRGPTNECEDDQSHRDQNSDNTHNMIWSLRCGRRISYHSRIVFVWNEAV